MDTAKLLEKKYLYKFGKFTLDAEAEMFYENERALRLPPKVLQVLILLVENHQRVVGREEFFEKVWADTFVEDGALSYSISQLRKTLAEFDRETKYIETVPKRGFRFVAEVAASLPENGNQILIEPIAAEPRIEKLEITQPAALPAETAPTKSFAKSNFSRQAIAAVVIIGVLAGIFVLYGTGKSKTSVKNIAVLPLKEIGDIDDKSLSLRITDSLITKLGGLRQVSVRPTSSVIKFAGIDYSTLEIGKSLQTEAILEGSIQKENDRLRVNLQMVEVATGKQLWTEQIDGNAAQLLDLQDAISRKLLERIDFSSTKAEENLFTKKITENQDAYTEYQLGKYLWQKRDEPSIRKSIRHFEKAINLDPKFAEAYIGLADAYYVLIDYSYDTNEINLVKAKENLSGGIALNPNLADAHTLLGLIQTTYEFDWNQAEISFQKALAIAPNSSNVYHRYAGFLRRLRRFDEAEKAMRRAKELDPTSTAVNTNLGVALYESKKYDAALEQFDAAIALDEKLLSPRWFRARCLWAKGDKTESLKEYERALRLNDDVKIADFIKDNLSKVSPEELIKHWAVEAKNNISPTRMDPVSMAVLASHLQDRDSIIYWLEEAVNTRHPWATSINSAPEFDFVRDDERFQNLLKKLNFKM